ncbi:hypothetical protein GUJ93_ZPchr0001g32814 [Zizania palustris]|uniref:non-specific serine/threonine protein kinase n=1 Tax=Zizania palustris TaxID=103762 RepID=A0A8J5RM48_ZIZPA|nr:hypothetical protein GUJ93_ZPchr0001g32814 [Zizania palustris]
MIMNLGHNWLFGVISAEIAEAKKLAVLDLSHNELERPIPNMFSSLSLSEINLSNNQLNGSIPELGTLVTFPQSQYENNSDLCGFPLPPCELNRVVSHDAYGHGLKNQRHEGITGGVVARAFLLLFTLVVSLLRRKRSKVDVAKGDLQHENVISICNFDGGDVYMQIIEATENFSEKYCIGAGGHGSVYAAELSTGEKFAIKKIHIAEDDHFRNEQMFIVK